VFIRAEKVRVVDALVLFALNGEARYYVPMRAVLVIIAILMMTQTISAIDHALGMTETKKINGSDVTVFVQRHGAKVVVQLIVVGAKPDSIKYEDVKVLAIDGVGAEVPMEKILPTTGSYGNDNGAGYGGYKLNLREGQRLLAIKVTWNGDSVRYPIKEQAP